MIRLALVDDHVILRKALAALIGKSDAFEVALEAGSGEDFLQQLKSNPLPDMVLLDIYMPFTDGVETAILLQRHYPAIKVIVLTAAKNDNARLRMIKSGARGFIFKDCEAEELFDALREVYSNGYYFNEQLAPEMTRQKPCFYKMQLNEQQRSFLRWAATGLTHREIAEQMQVSQRTVDSYRDILFKKLDINSRIGLVKYAIRNGFVSLEQW